jgi:2-keto-4-pentenoate hydratase/2-oxohepta-3-ene-1,7-dioic acid hydratase in catechol pathway
MKIVCIGRNYGAHAKELGNALPDEPVVFLKPESALIPKHGPIVLPTFSNDIQHEIELVYSIIRKNGKAQADKVSIGLDLTARSLQKALKDGGLPWEKSKSFDGSAYVAEAFTALGVLPARTPHRFPAEAQRYRGAERAQRANDLPHRHDHRGCGALHVAG